MTKDIKNLTPKRILEDLQTSGYIKEEAGLHTGNVLGYCCYYSHWYNAPPKVIFQHQQNANAWFGIEGVPNQQTGVHTQMPPPTIPENQDQTCIQMNNNNTSTPNANKLNLDDGCIQQHIERPDISQIPPQDDSYRSRQVTKTVIKTKSNNYQRWCIQQIFSNFVKWKTKPTKTISTCDARHEPQAWIWQFHVRYTNICQ